MLRQFFSDRFAYETGNKKYLRWVDVEVNTDCPPQSNDIDCGVHLCLNAGLLGLGEVLPSEYSEQVCVSSLFMNTHTHTKRPRARFSV